ncbi:MAG TPA: allophanate hydrolase [Rariglobus sp.]|jgi:allophanate hydrolase|nr:allophanate hydrolase [Rariglobus sp.]
MPILPDRLSLEALHKAALTPTALVEEIWRRCEAYAAIDPAVWIHRVPLDELRAHAKRLEALDPETLPLYGVPFAIKDNIDLAGVPTTAACPEFTYTPGKSAASVERLIAAGAIPVGKTNLDQFATGLVGVRSPYGAPRNIFNRDYISGGSSSGSAVAVAAGLVTFALGTDTAGSGRVPAAFNQLVGLKPTRGRLGTRGVVPACRTLDCVSIFALTCVETDILLAIAEGYDPADPFSRPQPAVPGVTAGASHCGHLHIGVPRPDQLEWFGNTESPALFAAALDRLRATGAEIIEVDFSPFLEAARLLYEGPWTAERYAAVGEFIETHASAPGLDATVAKIILGGKTPSAVDGFKASYRLAELRRVADTAFAAFDFLVAPTTGTIYKVSEIEADPIRLNSNLGRYNNFMNLLDLCGLTLPAGRYTYGPGFGITLIAPAWQDSRLLSLGARYLDEPAGAVDHHPPEVWITLAVCGAHLRGQPLNKQLTELGARFIEATTTAPHYRLYALANTTPPKPGLVRMPAGETGAAIAVETYALSPEAFGRFVASAPSPMVIGTAELADGTSVKSFLCEPCALAEALDITSFGGWISYRAHSPG